MTKTVKMTKKRAVTVDGMMTFDKSETGQLLADFKNYEGGEGIEPFCGDCKVQVMRGGDTYIEEKPKKRRVKGKRICRQDDSTLSQGNNGMYYFFFWLSEELLEELPDRLVRQANEAAAKMSGMFYKSKKKAV